MTIQKIEQLENILEQVILLEKENRPPFSTKYKEIEIVYEKQNPDRAIFYVFPKEKPYFVVTYEYNPLNKKHPHIILTGE